MIDERDLNDLIEQCIKYQNGWMCPEAAGESFWQELIDDLEYLYKEITGYDR